MGSKEVQHTVVVTGFGPFGNHNVNASWEAVKLIPNIFDSFENKPSNVRLVIEEIPVAYKNVSERIQYLWNEYKPIIIIHVGVSHLAECLTIECQALNVGYLKPDVHGLVPEEKDIEEEIVFKINVDATDICKAVNEDLLKINCKACTSTDAGRYLCEYILYKSLSTVEKDTRVLFIHVPEMSKYPSLKSAQGIFCILNQLIQFYT